MRDKTRLQMLQVYTKATIITVSEFTSDVRGLPHIDCDFKTPRGAQKVAEHVASFRATSAANCPTPDDISKCISGFPVFCSSIVAQYAYNPVYVTMFLDYVWLTSSYYQTRYGMFWLSTCCSQYVRAGVDEIFLPRDNGSQTSHDMDTMLAGPRSADIHVEVVPTSSNVLWASSNNSWFQAFLRSEQSSNSQQTSNYLGPGNSFVRVTRVPGCSSFSLHPYVLFVFFLFLVFSVHRCHVLFYVIYGCFAS